MATEAPASIFALPVRRPVATSMFFLALSLLGLFSWYRIPVELIPALSGEELFVQIFRPGSEPEVVEREILLPLESRIMELSGIEDTRAEITGASARLTVQFERGSDFRVRELEINRIAADLQRSQPQGSQISVGSDDSSLFSRLVLQLQVSGGEGPEALRDFVEERLQPRLASVPGVSQAFITGAPGSELTVWIDPERCAALGILPEQVSLALSRSVQHLRYLGGAESGQRRWSVMLDGRPTGVISLGNLRIDPARPVLLRHVADIELGTTRQESVFRIDGRPALGIILFQDEGANLVQMGRDLRARIEQLEAEFAPYGINFDIGFDAARAVEDQIDQLSRLALSGFLIALLVLYLFLRQLRAVAVVAIAVPVSLLGAGAMLYLGGWTLNIITLSGLAVGVGMLIDNSIVVFEAVQRYLERGLSPGHAAVAGIRRTVRAILATCATTAVVFLPATFLLESTLARSLITLISVAILLPLAASLLVAIFLVPLLAQRLAAPAESETKPGESGLSLPGTRHPQPAKLLFAGLLKSALRRPAPWVAGTTAVVLATLVVALPWVLVQTAGQQPGETDEVRFEVEIQHSASLDAASLVFTRLELAARDIAGVDSITSDFREDSGNMTVFLLPQDERPAATDAARLRRAVYEAAEDLSGVEVDAAGSPGQQGGEEGGEGLLGGSGNEILLSGPDMGRLHALASEIGQRLEAVPGVSDTSLAGREGQEELRVRPIPAALDSHRLFPREVLAALRVLRREGIQMQVGFTLPDGREIPLSVRQPDSPATRATPRLEALPLATAGGALPLGEVASISKEPPSPTIMHRGGRRALALTYRLSGDAPETGPARLRLDQQLRDAVHGVWFPEGYSVEMPTAEDNTSIAASLFVPMLFLLFAVLAITFESLTLPLLILLAVPLTILGATWALVFTGSGADMIAAAGAVALLGLSVNPAILLVDRMQRRFRVSGCGGGAAAIAAVKERTRPVLMTSATTIAGLWPLALSSGGEMEIWPPFAIVIIGGLTTATLLTLLIIPLGFVSLSRLDRLFARMGPWGLMAWAGATAALVAPLFLGGLIRASYWQVVTTVLVAGALLLVARHLNRPPRPAPLDTSAMSLETRALGKTYGLPGPLSRALAAAASLSSGAFPATRRERIERFAAHGLLSLGAGYLAVLLDSAWLLVFAYLAGFFLSLALIEALRLARPPSTGGRLETTMLYGSPWAVLAILLYHFNLFPTLSASALREPVSPVYFLILAALTLLLQAGRHTARRMSETERNRGLAQDEAGRNHGTVPNNGAGRNPGVARGGAGSKTWKNFSRKFFSLGLTAGSFTALSNVNFSATQGMIGILGPNGAGKTTLLRLLSGVLSPTTGTMRFAGRESRQIDAGTLSQLIGFLPQEFGLPDHLSAEDYLHYYAILYQVGDRESRRQRVDQLLRDVGLHERRHDRIGGYSGGMRQRVAVARTLLRLPPVIIVDEPTVGLDPRERIRFRNLLSKLAAGRVVLFSTHVVEDVAVSCSRVLVLSAGRVVYDDEPVHLAAHARGKVWELKLGAGEDTALPPAARVVDQVPETDGGARLRILCEDPPHERATAVEPTLEDGYLQLQREGSASTGRTQERTRGEKQND